MKYLRWVGLQDTYFLTALVFRSPVEQVALEPLLGEPGDDGGPMRFPAAWRDPAGTMARITRPRRADTRR